MLEISLIFGFFRLELRRLLELDSKDCVKLVKCDSGDGREDEEVMVCEEVITKEELMLGGICGCCGEENCGKYLHFLLCSIAYRTSVLESRFLSRVKCRLIASLLR